MRKIVAYFLPRSRLSKKKNVATEMMAGPRARFIVI